MNAKIAALVALVAGTFALLAWLLLSDMPDVETQTEATDELVAEADEPAADERRKVKREVVAKAEEPAEDKEMALPEALPKLKVQQPPADDPNAPPVEPPAAHIPPEVLREQQEVVREKALETGMRCWQQTRESYPEAKGEAMARLHLGTSDGGRIVVRNLEIDQVGDMHPELLACLDRELMRLDLDLPDGFERVVNAPLRLLPEGDPGMAPAGSVVPPPSYGRPHGEAAPGADPHPDEPRLPPGAEAPTGADPTAPGADPLPPGVSPEVNLRPGQAVAPPPGAAPIPR